jgi:molecular chaperone GrpE
MMRVKKNEKKGSHAKSKYNLRIKLREAEKEAAKWKDQCFRLAAELDNIKKRTEKEINQSTIFANAELIKKILPVIDDFERSLKFSENEIVSDFHTGVELIYKKLLTALMNSGLETIKSLCEPFDVDQHDALLQIEKEGVEPGLVIEEHEKGYRFRGKVLRHSKVIVSK